MSSDRRWGRIGESLVPGDPVWRDPKWVVPEGQQRPDLSQHDFDTGQPEVLDSQVLSSGRQEAVADMGGLAAGADGVQRPEQT